MLYKDEKLVLFSVVSNVVIQEMTALNKWGDSENFENAFLRSFERKYKAIQSNTKRV